MGLGKDLRTSWRYQTVEYFNNSTLHGVRYIAEKDRPFRERLMWFCFTLGGAIATLVIISSLWEKFQTNPTITGLDTDFHNWIVPFPSVTVCQKNPTNGEFLAAFIDARHKIDPNQSQYQYYASFYALLTELTYDNMDQLTKFYGDQTLNVLDFRDMVYQIINHCSDFLYDCEWKGSGYDCCEGFYPTFTERGFCYIFNSETHEDTWPWLETQLPPFQLKLIYETDWKWSLSFKSDKTNPLYVYIHNEDEVIGQDMQPQLQWDGHVQKILFSVKHTYTTEDVRQLSIKQRHCIFHDEVPLLLSDKYAYYTCTRQCRMENAQRVCGCIPYFYPLLDGFKYCTLTEFNCLAMNRRLIVDIERCNCELGCMNTVYEVDKFNLDNNGDGLELEFVSWPIVRYKREVIFGWIDLVVSFGGIAGLFLGFSLLSLVEIIYYFTLRAYCMVERNQNDLRQFRRDTEKKIMPVYNMSLRPYFFRNRIDSEYYAKKFDRFDPGLKLYNRSTDPWTIRRPDYFDRQYVKPPPPYGLVFLP